MMSPVIRSTAPMQPEEPPHVLPRNYRAVAILPNRLESFLARASELLSKTPKTVAGFYLLFPGERGFQREPIGA